MEDHQKDKAFIDRDFDYIYANAFKPHPAKKALRQATLERFPRASIMLTQEIQGDFMQMLIKSMRPKKCLELGVFTGYSALCMALGLPEDGRLIALDISEEFTSVAPPFWEQAGVSDKIELILGPAIEYLEKMIANGEQETVDFAYIDADKESQTRYYQLIMQLLRPGGMILIDNVLWSGRTADPEITDEETVCIRETIQHINADSRVIATILPFSDGIYQIVKN